MYKKIIVPLDGSALAEQALDPAIFLAKQAKAKLVLLSAAETKTIVATETTSGQGAQILERPHDHSQEALSTYLHGLRQEKIPSSIESTIKVVEGEAAGVILDTAVAEGVDLIIMSTHGRSGISRWIMGSVTERVLRHAPYPVLVIREPTQFNKMLITLDGSKISEHAIYPGTALAKYFGSHVTLLSVEPADSLDPSYVEMMDAVEPGLGDVLIGDFYHRTESYLQKTARWMQPNIEQEIDIAPKTGPITPVILDHIESNDIDITVLATHGRTGLRRWLYGSVTEKILRSTSCALLVVRPPLAKLE